MKNNTENNKIYQSNPFTRNTRTTTSAIFTVTSSGISSSQSINMNNQNISGLGTPSKNSDAVSLDYLQSNFVAKNDPNSGYLPTTGGTLQGDINMGGNKITNLSMPTSPQDSDAVTFKYLSEKVDAVTNNQQLNEAVNQMNSALNTMSNIEAALGIVTEDPNNPGSLPTANPKFISVNGGTMNGDLDMSNHTVTGIATPIDTDTQNAVNVEYVQSKTTLPKVGILGNTVTTSATSSNYLNWQESSTTPSPAPSPTPPTTSSSSLITTPNSETYLKIDDSDTSSLKILGTGILTLCFSITFNNTSGTQDKSSISVILNPNNTSGGGGSGSQGSTDNIVYDIPSLASGQSVCCQIPVQTQNSILKIKDNGNSTGGSSVGGGTSGTSNISSWSYQVTLLPSTFTASTNP
ncbi:phage tail protein [Chlamydia gallinacea]|uniref:phage tail protein n=1 Tax=Chlamydia gallinacea TaxID=1457153 RepID=UPI00098F0C72|nr:phage tail protein [Chlamydia gallinacea]AQT77366.1 phage tail protein [Chlamydia gallinacea]